MSTALTFDLQSPEVAGDGYWEALAALQAAGPVVWVESNGGYWAITANDLVLQAAQDHQTFSSAEGVAAPPRPGPDVVPYTVPLELDPPRQRAYRKEVNPRLTAKVVAAYEDDIRRIADDLIDRFADRGTCDVSREFARRFPGTVFFKLLIHCSDEEFVAAEQWARDITFEPPATDRWAAAMGNLRAWCATTLQRREGSDHEDDLVSRVRSLAHGEATFDADEMASGLQILVGGGIGTSANAIGVIMRVLSEDPDLQERVRGDLTLIPTLVEECLRLETPTPLMFRTVTRDLEFGGVQMAKGDKAGLFFGAANRDPAVFDHPSQVDLERPHYRHLSFGAGVHRCIGSNLARLQIRVAIEQLVTRLGRFWIPDGAEVVYSTAQARGISSLPLEFART